MGTLGEKRENKINNEIQKKAETICTFKYDYICGLSSSYSPKTVNVLSVTSKILHVTFIPTCLYILHDMKHT